MKLSLFYLLLCVSSAIYGSVETELRGILLKRQIENGELPYRLDRAIEKIVDIAEWKLKEADAEGVAQLIRGDYEKNYRDFVETYYQTDGLKLTQVSFGIGDHPNYVLSKWLDDFYNKVQDVLGYDVMRSFHLTDIKSLNWGVRVVLDPCNPEWDINEYRNHFSGGTNESNQFYDGVIPVMSYWSSMIVCEIATSGPGWFLLCAPFSQLVEMGVENFIAPQLSDSLWIKTCQ